MEEEVPQLRIDPWMRGLLLIAGAYNLGWGAFIYYFPASFYQWVTEGYQDLPALIKWQGLGVLLFGLGYILTAVSPRRYWWVVPLGIVSKCVGAIGFYFVFMEQTITRPYLFHLIMNDLLWLIPLTIIFVRMVHIRKQRIAYEQVT